MQKTFIWEIIAQLNTTQRREFKEFLASPYFNKRQDMIDLYAYLCPYLGKKEVPNKEKAWANIHPNATYEVQQMRLTLSYLFRLLEQYLTLSEMQQKAAEQPQLLLAAYRKMGLDRHWQKAYHSIEKRLEKRDLRHPEYYFAHFLLEKENYQQLAKTGRTKELNLQVVEDQLDAAVLSLKLRQACFSRSHEAVFKAQYRIDLLDELMALAQTETFRNLPAVAMYYHCYLALFYAPSEANFQAFREQLFSNTNTFPQEELRDLYLLAINYCIKKINAADRTYLRPTLDLYRKGLEEEILLENGQLSRFTYNNVVASALSLQEFSWAAFFVEKYQHHLPEKWREASYSLNSARLAYARKQYDAALSHLQRADYRDYINNMVAKILQMKIYFETDQFDVLDHHLQTMRMFIRRNKKISYHHQNWSNIVRYMRKLMELNSYDKTAVLDLRAAIEQEEIMTERAWFLAQL